MADVFVSYARPDELHAQRVAESLRAAGYRVWRDDELPAHRAYADVIAERLASASAVVVLWSLEATRSQWVRAEADEARSSGTLIQARIEACTPPMPFNQIQCADLIDWNGKDDTPGWRKLMQSVAALADESPPSQKAALPSRSKQICVCVLPFSNMSGDAEQGYFSDGISEDITTDLSKISALGVTARNTAFTFKDRAVNVCDVARELGVSHVLEGSVRKVGDRVRINAQLIDGGSGEHVWAERYDRDLTDIFQIQDEISESIVAALRLKLLPEEKKAIEQRGTTDVGAYKLYLLARQYWATGNHGDIRREQRVMRISSRAVEIDPYYAQAWALLAMAQSNLRYEFGSEVEDGVAAANAALSIDPTIAEAHCPMMRRLEEQARYDEAEAELRKALDLDPESWEVNKEAGRVRMREQQLPEAARHFEKAIEAMSSDVHAWAMLVTCYQTLEDEAAERNAAQHTLREAERVLAGDPSNGAALAFGARAFAGLDQVEHAREGMDRALLIDSDNLSMRFSLACMLTAKLGDYDRAMMLLQRNFSYMSRYQLSVAANHPDLLGLREDSRFINMVARARKRLGLPDGGPTAAAASPRQAPQTNWFTQRPLP
jgi:adenylate cyclase